MKFSEDTLNHGDAPSAPGPTPAQGELALLERVRQLECELRVSKQNEARLSAFLEFASQGVVAVDEAGAIMMVNAKTEEMFGYPRKELLGQRLELLLPRRYRAGHVRQRGDYFTHPRTRPMGLGMDLWGARKDGSEFPVEVSLSWVEESGRRVALAFVTDITERKRLNEELQQTQKLESLGVLAGGVAHDFNNLLTGVMGNASLALEALPPSHPIRNYLAGIVSSSHRAAELTRQLLAYAGKGRFVIGHVDLSELVREIAPLAETSLPKSVQLRLSLAEGLPPIEADASHIQQVVMNLIVNAGEAMAEGVAGTVMVSTGTQTVDELYIRTVLTDKPLRPGEYVYLEVNDTGKGMDEDTMSKIFDPFFTTKFTGRGLGLAAVSGIVRTHRGAIKVYSEPGKGTTFKVLFPAVAPHQEATLSNSLAGEGLVLVVDDEAVVRQTAKAALERYGYTVITAENGQAAVNLYRDTREPIALVLLDLTMPGLSGEETLRQLEAVRPGARVLLSSGYNESEAVRRFEGRRVVGFIQKPYTSAQIAEKVKLAINGE